jgi:hypothetical protein
MNSLKNTKGEIAFRRNEELENIMKTIKTDRKFHSVKVSINKTFENVYENTDYNNENIEDENENEIEDIESNDVWINITMNFEDINTFMRMLYRTKFLKYGVKFMGWKNLPEKNGKIQRQISFGKTNRIWTEFEKRRNEYLGLIKPNQDM